MQVPLNLFFAILKKNNQKICSGQAHYKLIILMKNYAKITINKKTRDRIDKLATTTKLKRIDNSKERVEKDKEEKLVHADCIAAAMKLD